MPKEPTCRVNHSMTTANQTRRSHSTSGAVPSQPLTSNLSMNYTAIARETLRLVLFQHHLSQTGSCPALIAQRQESNSLRNISATFAPPVFDQLLAMIAFTVDSRLGILHSRDEPEPDSARALSITESLAPVPTEQVMEPTPPPLQLFNGGQDGGHNGVHS